MKKKFIAKDTEIHWEIYPKSDSIATVVLLHGFMCDSSIWDAVVANSRFTCITIDLPGFGASKKIAHKNYSLAHVAELLHALALHEKWENITVIGHSMGGYIALEWLKLKPLYITKCGLLHSTPLEDSSDKKANRTKTIKVLEEKPNLFIQEFYANLFATENKHKFEDEIAMLKLSSKKIAIQHIIETQKALRDRSNNWEVWNNYSFPKAVFLGKHDQLISYEDQIQLHQNKEFIRYVFENSGHMSFYEEPHQFAKFLQDFVEIK